MGRPRIALIATYPKMSKMFITMTEDTDIVASSVFASFDDAVKMAKDMEDDVDVILSRGGTGIMLKKALEIPVINVPITPFDVLAGLQELDGSDVKSVAFIHSEEIGNLYDVEKMTGVAIKEYFFNSKEDIKRAVEEARDLGIEVIIGGQVGTKYAEELGLRGIEISAGEDSLQRAVREAVQIVDLNEIGRRKSSRIKAAFDAISEGIIVTDELGRIVTTNSQVKTLVGKQRITAGDFNDEEYEKVFSGKSEESSRVRRYNNDTIAVSHRRIMSGEQFDGVITTLEKVSKIQKMEKKIRNALHQKGFVAKYNFKDIIGETPEMKDLKSKAALYAASNSNILIEGESGTGKELFAQSIHLSSKRSEGPFVAINCAAIPANLLESELFGYEGGAFTGASKEGKMGLFEMAHEGTIFLDEIAELPIDLQSRILRVLQEREVMRIGGDKIIPVNIRVLSATNRNIKDMVAEKAFREDLYYRLNVFNINLIPLRNRRDDIPLLLQHLLSSMNFDIDEEKVTFLCSRLRHYDWPGNIRELQNVAERISVLCDMIDFESISDDDGLMELLGIYDSRNKEENALKYSLKNGLKGAVSDIEKQIIEKMMDEYGDDQDAVANILQIGRTTLWRKIKGNQDD